MNVTNVINFLLITIDGVSLLLGGLSFLVRLSLYVVTTEHKPDSIQKMFQPLFLAGGIVIVTKLISLILSLF